MRDQDGEVHPCGEAATEAKESEVPDDNDTTCNENKSMFPGGGSEKEFMVLRVFAP